MLLFRLISDMMTLGGHILSLALVATNRTDSEPHLIQITARSAVERNEHGRK